MIKYFCDICGNQIGKDAGNPYKKVLYHLRVEVFTYFDEVGLKVSPRHSAVCFKCVKDIINLGRNV